MVMPSHLTQLQQVAADRGLIVRDAPRGARGKRIAFFDPSDATQPSDAGFVVAIDYQLGSDGPAPHSHGSLVFIHARHGTDQILLAALEPALLGINGNIPPVRNRST